jgi:hypothetical protein
VFHRNLLDRDWEYENIIAYNLFSVKVGGEIFGEKRKTQPKFDCVFYGGDRGAGAAGI